jgi:2-methylcitrate dehydratase
MPMTSITRQMADFVHQLEYDDIAADALHEAKRFILDSIGCALAAAEGEDMAAMHRFIEKLGGPPEATVIATGHRTSAANAALMNGLLIRALDYNDIYWVQDPSHPSDLLGVVLSAAEANERSGRELLVAAVIAYELEMRWCHAAHPGIREIGWHHASLTQFVSPLVAGRLYGLSEEQLVAAAGICGSSHFTLGGVVAGHLTNMKNTADPLAAQAGILAAMMAREGCSGPDEVIEGKEGLFEVLRDVEWDASALIDGLGESFLITQCSYKAFPTEALTHQPISAALSLRKQHGIPPERIQEVLVETTTRGADILSDPSKYQPDTRETADHSLPFVLAVALAHGHVLPDAFEDDALRDPVVRSLLPKIKVSADAEIDALFPRVKRARVTIRTTEDHTFTRETDIAKGDPQDPLTDAELIQKFHANAGRWIRHEQAEQIIAATMRLETVDDMSSYMSLLTRAG